MTTLLTTLLAILMNKDGSCPAFDVACILGITVHVNCLGLVRCSSYTYSNMPTK